MDKNFYITTRIYDPSGKPHMGHAYSSIIAYFFARFKLIDDYNVHFLKRISYTKIFNLDEESLFMEFEDEILNG